MRLLPLETSVRADTKGRVPAGSAAAQIARAIVSAGLEPHERDWWALCAGKGTPDATWRSRGLTWDQVRDSLLDAKEVARLQVGVGRVATLSQVATAVVEYLKVRDDADLRNELARARARVAELEQALALREVAE